MIDDVLWLIVYTSVGPYCNYCRHAVTLDTLLLFSFSVIHRKLTSLYEYSFVRNEKGNIVKSTSPSPRYQIESIQSPLIVSVHRCGCLELYYCNMVEWSSWDSSLI